MDNPPIKPMTEVSKLQKEIIKHHKITTILCLVLIIANSLLLTIYTKCDIFSILSVFGLSCSIWTLSKTRTELKYQLKELKRIKKLEDKIIEKQKKLQAMLEKQLQERLKTKNPCPN